MSSRWPAYPRGNSCTYSLRPFAEFFISAQFVIIILLSSVLGIYTIDGAVYSKVAMVVVLDWLLDRFRQG